MNAKNIIVKVEQVKKPEKKEDVFHLDDDVTKDYLKGKDRGLMLEDRYEREKKEVEEVEEKNERENQMYGICLYFLRPNK